MAGNFERCLLLMDKERKESQTTGITTYAKGDDPYINTLKLPVILVVRTVDVLCNPNEVNAINRKSLVAKQR